MTTPRPGSPDFFREREDRSFVEWIERWLPSLRSDITLEDAIASNESFAYLTRLVGTDRKQRLADAVPDEGVLILAEPRVLPMWVETFDRAGHSDVRSESILRARGWSEGEEISMTAAVTNSVHTLIIETTFSDKTKSHETASNIGYRFEGSNLGRVITVAHFMLEGTKIPRETSSALKALNRSSARRRKEPIPVVWYPRMEPEAFDILDRERDRLLGR